MRTGMPHQAAVLAACVLGLVTLSACEQADPLATDGNQQLRADRQARADVNHALARVRRATARYNDLRAATAEGFVQFSLHVPGMGIHYLHPSAVNSDGSSALDDVLDRGNPEVLVYVDQPSRSGQMRLVAVEYAVPKDGEAPPQNAVDLFPGADEDDWHVHPSAHEFGPPLEGWTLHGECHYQGGIGVFLAEKPDGGLVLWTPPSGELGSWSGTVAPGQCPTELGGDPLPPLLIAHGKWWTLHAWVWMPNPEGVFHAKNPRVQ